MKQLDQLLLQIDRPARLHLKTWQMVMCTLTAQLVQTRLGVPQVHSSQSRQQAFLLKFHSDSLNRNCRKLRVTTLGQMRWRQSGYRCSPA
jgi:hypothetical protein